MTDKLTVSLKPSPLLALVLVLMAGAALMCAWISLPGLAFAPAAIGIVLAGASQFAQAMQWGGRAARALELSEHGAPRWLDAAGQWREAEILPGSYASAWLVVVNLGASGRRDRSIVLLPDSAAAEELRRLRIWLRWRLKRA